MGGARSKSWKVAAAVAWLVVFALAASAQAPAPAPPEAPAGTEKAPSAGKALLKEGKYTEALEAFDRELKTSPDDPEILWAHLDALIGVGRYPEAAKRAMALVTKFPGRPEFRFSMGEALYGRGMMTQAAQVWAALAKDATWGNTSAVMSARAYLSVGKEEEARKVVADALASRPHTSAALLRLRMAFSKTGKEGVEAAEALAKAVPESRDEYAGLARLFAEAGDGPWCGEDAPPTAPVTVALKEKSERLEFSSLAWGSTGSDEVSTSTRVLLPVKFKDGKERWMLLDSGASMAMVSAAVARELGLQPVATAEYIGLGQRGARTSSWVLLREFGVGGLTFRNVPAILIEEKADFWEKTAGILPMEIFRHFAVQYDRRHSKLTLHPPGTKPEAVLGAGTFAVKTLWFDGNPFVETTLQGQKEAYFLLDTGASSTYLNSKRTDALGIKMTSVRYAPQTAMGLSGTFRSGVAADVTLLLGASKFDFPAVHAMPIGWGEDVPCFGLLGRSVLDKFAMFFDYTKNVTAFCPYDR